jgi:Astacin (Peptidase family M12A)
MKSWQSRSLCLLLAIGCGTGCTPEAPAHELNFPHGAGAAADRSPDRAPEVRTGTIATAAGPTEIRYEVKDGQAVFQGDILIPWSDFIDPRASHAATVKRDRTWPAGVVPYVIDPSVRDPQRITAAIAHWHQRTAIRLVPRTFEQDLVRFVDGADCSSYLGRTGGVQDIVLNMECPVDAVIHEIGHAIGLDHEPSRQDRDDHVIIHWENIEPDLAYNFNKYTSGMDVGPYDYNSVMHYGSYAGSVNGLPTITKRSGGLIPDRYVLSLGDLLAVEHLYGPPFQIGRASALDRSGRLELFAKGADHAIWHIAETAPNGAWTSWQSLGGSLRSAPTVARNLDGRLEVFAVGWDNQVYHQWQLVGGGWSGWWSMGGQLQGLPIVARNLDGRLEVFGLGTDNAIWHAWQSAANGGWGGWSALGGWLQGDPAVGQNLDGRLQVFAIGSDSAIWTAAQVAPNGGWGGWSALGGAAVGSPAVGRNLGGRLEVFATGLDGTLQHNPQQVSNGSFVGWTSLGAEVLGSPAVGRNADGRLEVLAVAPDTSLGHIWQLVPGGAWSGWASYGGTTSTRRPDVARHQDGRMEALAVGINDRVLYHQAQAAPSGWWSGWAPYGGITVVPD